MGTSVDDRERRTVTSRAASDSRARSAPALFRRLIDLIARESGQLAPLQGGRIDPHGAGVGGEVVQGKDGVPLPAAQMGEHGRLIGLDQHRLAEPTSGQPRRSAISRRMRPRSKFGPPSWSWTLTRSGP